MIRCYLRDNVRQVTDLGVGDLAQVGLNVTVEIALDIGILGLVGEASSGTVIPVPAIRAIVWC